MQRNPKYLISAKHKKNHLSLFQVLQTICNMHFTPLANYGNKNINR